MSAKHTPGPWQHSAKLSASENHRGFTVWNSDGWGLADVQPADEDGREGEANARLIAAAPELLEALQAVVSQLEGHDLHNGDVFAINNAYAAIAKATNPD